MSIPPRLQLTETSPGVYETYWTVPADTDPGLYDAVGSFILGGVLSSVTPPSLFMVLAAAPAPIAVPAVSTPPPAEGGAAPVTAGAPTPPAAPIVITAWAQPAWGGTPGRNVPAGELWVTPDDVLIIGVRCSQPSMAVTAAVRLWSPDGTYQGGAITITPPSDRSLHFTAMPLSYGYLAAAAVQSVGNSPQRGQLLCSLRLARGALASFQTFWFLAQDYLTNQQQVGWWPGRIAAGIEGPGWINQVAIGTPPAGGEFSLNVPAGVRWKLRAITAGLITANAGVPRTVALRWRGFGPTDLLLWQPSILFPINTSGSIFWIPGLARDTQDGAAFPRFAITAPPDLVLRENDALASFTVGINGADQYNAITATVEEWLSDL